MFDYDGSVAGSILLLKIQFIMLLKLMVNGVWLKPWTKLKKDGHLLIISKNVHQMKPKNPPPPPPPPPAATASAGANGASNPVVQPPAQTLLPVLIQQTQL